MRMMVRLSRENNQTLVIVTHDQEIAAYADRIVTIRDGVLIEDKPNQSLADRPEDEQAMLEQALSPEQKAEP
jgi:putative ABC transport system ATP-binding protein